MIHDDQRSVRETSYQRIMRARVNVSGNTVRIFEVPQINIRNIREELGNRKWYLGNGNLRMVNGIWKIGNGGSVMVHRKLAECKSLLAIILKAFHTKYGNKIYLLFTDNETQIPLTVRYHH